MSVETQQEYQRKWRAKNREKCRQYGIAWRKKNPEKNLAKQRKYDASHPKHASWDRMKKWRKENKDHVNSIRRAREKKWRQEHKKEVSEYARNWRKNHPDNAKNSFLKYNYGITLDEFNSKLQEQDNKCSLCFKELDSVTRATKPHVDHDHATDQVRDLICARCNATLGQINDDVELLDRYIKYIEKYREVYELKSSSNPQLSLFN